MLALITPMIGVPTLWLLSLVVISAVGVGPALRLTNNLALAPALGLTICTSVGVSIAYVFPLHLAGPIFLLVTVALSVAWAAPTLRRIHVNLTVFAGSVALLLLGGASALYPALGHHSYGPVDLVFNDSWFYAGMDWWMQHHKLTDAVGNPSQLPALAIPQGIQATHTRVGIDAWQSSFASLVGVDPVVIQSALMATTVAVIVLTTAALLRIFAKLRPLYCALGAIFALSPITVQLFIDPRPANLAAIVFAPIILFFGARGLTALGTKKDMVIAGCASIGLLTTYPEHGPTVVFAAASMFVLAVAVVDRRRAFLTRAVRRVAVGASVAVGLCPPGVYRAWEYAHRLGSGNATGAPRLAGVRISTLPPLLMGTLHLHELDEVSHFSVFKTLATYDVAIAVAGVIVFSAGTSIGRRRRATIESFVPLVVIIVSSTLFGYFQLKGGCGDCVYKSVTLTPVFLSVGIVVGIAHFLHRRVGRVGVVALLLLAAGILSFQIRGQYELQKGDQRTTGFAQDNTVTLAAKVKKLPKGGVLVEGSGNTSGFQPFFHAPEMFYLLGRDPNHPLSFDQQYSGLVGGTGLSPAEDRTDYEYVVTGYPGMVTSRTPIEVSGEYAITIRAPQDLVVRDAGGTRDPEFRGPAAIPWLQGALPLRVANVSQGATILLTLTGAGTTAAPVGASEPFRSLPSRARGQSRICVSVPRGRSIRDFVVTSAAQPGSFVPNEVDGPPPVRKIVGLAGWRIFPRDQDCQR